MSHEVRWDRPKQWFSTGWRVQAFVCLECGLLTQYLSAADLAKLKEKNASNLERG